MGASLKKNPTIPIKMAAMYWLLKFAAQLKVWVNWAPQPRKRRERRTRGKNG